MEPETLDGSPTGTDINEYFIHFEQISDWNEWTEHQRARSLTIKLRGEAQKLFSSLPYTQFIDYATLKQALIQRFSPNERRENLHTAANLEIADALKMNSVQNMGLPCADSLRARIPTSRIRPLKYN